MLSQEQRDELAKWVVQPNPDGTPKNKVDLQQQVYLALSQAQLALWNNQSARFQQSLKEAEQLLVDYQQLNSQYAAILTEVQALQTLNITHPVKTLCLGLPDQFIEHGVHETMLSNCGLDAKGISSAIAKLIS